MNIDPIHADLRTAIHIKNALDTIDRLKEIGYCPTKVQKFCDYFDVRSEGISKEEEKSRSRDLANQVRI